MTDRALFGEPCRSDFLISMIMKFRLLYTLLFVLVSSLSFACSSDTTNRKDDTSVPEPPCPSPEFVDPHPGALLVVFENKCPKEVRPFVASLQGLLNKKGKPCYLAPNGDNLWYRQIKESAAEVVEYDSLKDLLADYGAFVERYVRCRLANVTVGATVAGPLDAVIVPDEVASSLPVKQWKQVADVCGKTESWLYDYVVEHLDSYDRTAILNKKEVHGYALIDLTIAKNYISVVCKNMPELMRKFYALIEPNSPRFGYGAPYGNEFKDISMGAEYGIYTVPTDLTLNLSFFGRQTSDRVQPAPESFNKELDRKRAHYVMIMYSDGDNMNWMINNCIATTKYMGNPVCNEFPVNWMYPPHMMTSAGMVHDYYLDHRPKYNYYLGGLSGMGYTYPSYHKNLEEFARKSDEGYHKAGLDYCVVMDDKDFTTREKSVLEQMTVHMPHLKGIYYMDYGNYAKWQGDTYTVGKGIPVHAFRYRLWLPFDPLEDIARKINSSSRDPHSLDAYSSVVVHAWSYKMEDVKRFVSLLDDDVVLVNAEEFMTLLKKNILNK